MRRGWALSVALGLAVGCGKGDGDDDDRAFLQGVVLDVETGAPLEGVTVRSAPVTGSAVTGPEGRFLIREGVRFNQLYRVFAEREGFSSSFADFTPRASDRERSITLQLQRLRLCSPGSTRCAAGGAEEAVQRCADGGTRFETVPCAETEICRVDACVPARTLRVMASGGLVTSQPVGISCNPNCEARFPAGTAITLMAQPFAGGQFSGWSGPCPDPMVPSCALTLDGDVEVTASFGQSALPLEVDFRGDGAGRVASAPAGLDCTADCTVPFERGSQVSLEATPEPGSVFAGWAGACLGPSCSVRMDQARSVDARFEIDRRTVTVSVDGGGRVTSSPAGLDCPGSCSFDFGVGSQVELLAAPGAGQALRTWSGACTDRGPCVLDISSDVSVDASFVDFYLVPLVDDMACVGGFGLDAGARLQNDCGAAAAVEIGPWSSVAARTIELADGYRASSPGAALDSGLILVPGPATIELSARRTGDAFGGAGYGVLVADREERGPGLELRLHDDGRLEFVTFSGTATTSVQTSAGTLAADQWGHVAVSTNGTDVSLRLDGEIVATGTVSWTASSSTAWVGAGRQDTGPRQGLNGDVDEIRFSDVARY
jgi:hypothetical protein